MRAEVERAEKKELIALNYISKHRYATINDIANHMRQIKHEGYSFWTKADLGNTRYRLRHHDSIRHTREGLKIYYSLTEAGKQRLRTLRARHKRKRKVAND